MSNDNNIVIRLIYWQSVLVYPENQGNKVSCNAASFPVLTMHISTIGEFIVEASRGIKWQIPGFCAFLINTPGRAHLRETAYFLTLSMSSFDTREGVVGHTEKNRRLLFVGHIVLLVG